MHSRWGITAAAWVLIATAPAFAEGGLKEPAQGHAGTRELAAHGRPVTPAHSARALPSSAALDPSAAAERDELFAADRALSQRTHDQGLVPGMLPAFTDDALFMWSRVNILEGREAIRAYFTSVDPQGTAQLSWTVLQAIVSVSGDLGFTYGNLKMATPQTDGTIKTTLGVYAAVWERHHGAWRLRVFSRAGAANDNVPPEGTLPLPAGTPQLTLPFISRYQVFAADTAFAALSVEQGVRLSFVAYADVNAVEVTGVEYVAGRRAVEQWHHDDPLPSDEVLNWGPLYGGAALAGDFAWTVGSYTDQATGDPTIYYGKYITAWAHQPDGSWKWIIDTGSSSPAPTSP